MGSEAPMGIRKGLCLAYDDKGNEVAWLAVDQSGRGIAYNDEGALYVLSSIHVRKVSDGK